MRESSKGGEHALEVGYTVASQRDRVATEQKLRVVIADAERLDPESEPLAKSLTSLAQLRYKDGDYSTAVALFRRALGIAEKVLGRDHYDVIQYLRNLAAAYAALDDVAEVEALLERSLSIAERHRGPDDPEVAVCLSDLVRLRFRQSAFAAAEPLLLRLLDLKREQGPERSEVATILASLATVRHVLGRHESAEQLWRRALEIRQKSLAPNHYAIARNLEHLADACTAQGKLEEALSYLRRALEMREQTMHAADPSVAAVRAKIADLQLLVALETAEPGSAQSPRAPQWPGLGDHRLGLLPGRQGGQPGGDAIRKWPDSPESAADMPPEESTEKRKSGSDDAPNATSAESAAATDACFVVDATDGPCLLLGVQDGEQEDSDSNGSEPRAGYAERWWPPLPSLDSLVERALGARPRTKMIAGGAAAVALLVLVSLLAHRVGARPAMAPHKVAESGKLVVTAAGGQLGAAGALPEGAAIPRSSTTSVSGAHPLPTVERDSASAVPPKATEPRAADAAPHRADVQLPNLKSSLIDTALGAFESTTLRRADSAMRVLTGRALTSDHGRRDFAAAGASAGQPGGGPDGRPATTGANEFQPPVLAADSPMPKYPPELRSAGTSGNVLVEFVVDSNGSADMSSFSVLHSDDMLFTRAVRDALPRMRFIPAESGGRKVSRRLQMPFSFSPGSR